MQKNDSRFTWGPICVVSLNNGEEAEPPSFEDAATLLESIGHDMLQQADAARTWTRHRAMSDHNMDVFQERISLALRKMRLALSTSSRCNSARHRPCAGPTRTAAACAAIPTGGCGDPRSYLRPGETCELT